MAEPAPQLTADMAEELQTESHAPYLKVWAGLGVLTAVEYVYALVLKDSFLFLVLGLVSLALVKAGMVGWFFMHLKFEKPWVYILIIPACVMAVFLTLALVPDQAMRPVDEEEETGEQAWTVPTTEFTAAQSFGLAAIGRSGSAPAQSGMAADVADGAAIRAS